MTELWTWVERIGGGLLALLLLGVVVTYVPIIFGWLWRVLWQTLLALGQLPSLLLALWRNPWECMRKWSDQSTLFAIAISPFILLLEKCSPAKLAKSRPASALQTTKLHATVADSKGRLTAHGIWALAQAVHGFCDQKRDPLWRFTHEHPEEDAITAWHQAFIAAMAEWADVLLWVEIFEPTWGTSAWVHLSEGEFLCTQKRSDSPSRNPWTYQLNESAGPRKQGPTASNPMRLGDLIQTRYGVDSLLYRLDKQCVAPYEAIDIPPLADEAARNRMVWTWNNQSAHPMALAWPDLSGFLNAPETLPPVLFPRPWGTLEKSYEWFGELTMNGGNTIIVADASGHSGIVQLMDIADPVLGDVIGGWLQPCCWGYLNGTNSALSVFEAVQTLAADVHGEMLCDLIQAATGERLNPPGIKVLAGTIGSSYCIVANETADAATPRRLDRLSLTGPHCCGQPATEAKTLRWAAIWNDNEGYAPVQSPENGLWGFIDREGSIAIAPQFARVGHFQRDLAAAWPADTPEKMGLINEQGKWVIAPQWQHIDPQNRRQFVVQDSDDCWGAVDEVGKLIVPLQARAVWLTDTWIAERIADELAKLDPNSPWQKDCKALEEDALIDGIARQWHAHVRLWVQTALTTPPYSLALLEGVFDNDARQSDLAQAGLWGMKVRVLDDQTSGILQPKAGETGHIFTQYPVGLSCFDLSVQVPVCGLATQPEAVIGIAWRNLEAVRE